ncbi:methyltransferase domain-containing protein [Natronomonas salina]|uniref:class I SAM-dependent methyltransferase n=1 Tax=Natronomonas salina TaxID=1710540 RepID=UPI0015B522F9|nr:class I SAM-dependent methyltransferase [Natronomonas salina]QLD89649.1 methyltransferase domain-containing protein [Natronomonas salina]
MDFHTFDADDADRLEEAGERYRFLSREELLYHLDPGESSVLADLGSGTGFFTDEVAPHAQKVYAIDVQPEMHEYYRGKGVPSNVDLVTANAETLPFDDAELDGVFSTMTFHEVASSAALTELARVMTPEGRIVIVDWSKEGSGEAGPPIDERFTSEEASNKLRDAGFDIETSLTRFETFIITGVRRTS